jgi:hypothetical protein
MPLMPRMMDWLALMLSCMVILPGIALGDNPCEDVEKTVARFAASLPTVATTDLRQGIFEIAEEDNRLTVSYTIAGKAVFQQEFPTPDAPDVMPTVTPTKMEGYATLFVGYSFGAGGAIAVSPSRGAHGR